MNGNKQIVRKKSIAVLLIVSLIVSIVCSTTIVFADETESINPAVEASATTTTGTKIYIYEKSYIVGVPAGGWVTITVRVRADEHYKNTSSTKRTFNNRCYTVFFRSPNDRSILSKLSASFSGSSHYKADGTKIGSAGLSAPNHSIIYDPSNLWTYFHKDSKTSLVHDRNTNSYALTGYGIIGGVNVVSKSLRLVKMGK